MDSSELEKRLQSATYRDDAEVHFGIAESGKDPAKWVGVPERLASRITTLGEAYELHHLPMIDIYADTIFTTRQCENLKAELQFLSEVVSDPALNEVVGKVSALLETALAKSWRLFVSGN